MQLTAKDKNQLNEFERFFGYKITKAESQYLNSPARIRALFTGNQRGKTAGTMYDLVLSLLDIHPVPERNFDYYKCQDMSNSDIGYEGCDATWNIPKWKALGVDKCPKCGDKVEIFINPIRRVRLGSENLPVDTGSLSDGGTSTEGKNTQYPELKKWLPGFLIISDISIRRPWLVIKNHHGYPDMMVEFVSYNQTIQSQAGVQLFICKMDEEPPYDFLEETRPRLIAANGYMDFALTPANRITYLFDEVFERASVYYRTQAVADRLHKRDPNKLHYPLVEYTKSEKDIHVFQAATDDNPTLTKAQIERAFDDLDDDVDPDTIDIRRYGLFRAQSGRIYKGFARHHILKPAEWFPQGIPSHWLHARGIDYHPHVAWHHGWAVLSPDNEMFIYDELILSPESFTTEDQMNFSADKSKNYLYKLNLIDPLANTNQANTGRTTIEDINDVMLELRRSGRGTGGHWEPWDTKSTFGREELRKRLKNSTRVGKPFNNLVIDTDELGNRKAKRLPTIWIMSNCKFTIEYMRKWRLQEHKDRDARSTKDQKEQPQEKWSHMNMVWEAILKDPRWRPPKDGGRKRVRGPYDRG